jgi:ABC-2 type transport system permease protein
MTTRHLRNLARQPWWIAITLVQPVIWLLLFGAVFTATADIPGSPPTPTSTSSPPGSWS